MAQKKIQKHIEIVRSTGRLTSMGPKSGADAQALFSKHYATVGTTVVHTVSELDAVIAKRPDLVFIGLKYLPGETPNSKIWVSDYLDQHGIAYTGSAEAAIRLEEDKTLAKQRVLDAKLKTSPYVIAKQGQSMDSDDIKMRYPLFVKPTNLGGGKGVDENSVVYDKAHLESKVLSLATDHGVDALIEEYLPGREFSVAILRHEDSEDLMVMPIELVAGANARGDRILSHQLKAAVLETPVFPVTDMKLRAELSTLATDVFGVLGVRDYGRIDIRLDAEGTPYFLEANLIPCLIDGSGNFPKACKMNIDMNHETMMLHIARLGLSRASSHEDSDRDMDSMTTRNFAITLAS